MSEYGQEGESGNESKEFAKQRNDSKDRKIETRCLDRVLEQTFGGKKRVKTKERKKDRKKEREREKRKREI